MANKKTLRVATSLMLVASTAAVAATPTQTDAATKKTSPFTDVKKGDYFHDAVVTLTDEGVLNGYGDKTFRPNVPTTRGHIAIVLTRVLGLKATQYVNIQDMPHTHDTYEYAAAAITHGFMKTDRNNNFNPRNELSRYEYAEILMNAYNLKPTYKNKHQFKNIPKQYEVAVQTVIDHGLMRGVSTTDFGGSKNITRGQMAVTLMNARNLGPSFAGQMTTRVLSYNSVTEKVMTTNGEFNINAKLKPLFTSSDKTILQNAVITGNFAGNELVSIQDLELGHPGYLWAKGDNQTLAELKPNVTASRNSFLPTPIQKASNNTVASNVNRVLDLGGVTIPGKIILKRERTTIRNGSAGQIIVTDEADRDLTLEAVKVKDLIVQDGYYRDFVLTLTNTVPNRLTIDRDDVHLKSNQKVPQVLLTDNVYTLESQSAIGMLQLTKSGHASLYGQISIDRLLVAEEADVYIGSAGYIKEAEILAQGGKIRLTRNVRMGTVTIPPFGDYGDYLDYSGDIKEAVAKVKVPGSEDNLFHNVIQLPSKEEMQRQELFDKLVEQVEASASKNQFTFVTRLNSYATSMRDYPVRMYFTLTSGLGHLPGNTVIPTKITFKGNTTTHNFTVDHLRQGVLTVNAKGELLTLKDLSPNSNNRLIVEFDTPFPMTVRGNLEINGYTKGASEVLVNSQFAEDVKTLVNSMAVTQTAAEVNIEKRYGTVSDQFDQLTEDFRLQLTQLRKPEADSKIVPFMLTYKFDGKDQKKEISNVTLAQLKSGVSLYSLLGVNEKKILKAHSGKVEAWDIQFNDTIDADFKVVSSVVGLEVKSTSFTVNYANTAMKAVKDLATTVNKGTVKLSKTYNNIDSSLVNKAQDVKMTLTSVTTPSTQSMRVPFTIKYKLADGQELTKEITNLKVEDLTKGVSLYSQLGLEAQELTAELGGKVEAFEIQFKESLKGSFKFEAIVGGSVEQINTATVDSQVAATPSIAKVDLEKANRGFKVTKTFGTIQAAADGRTTDMKLKVLSPTTPTANGDKVEFKIKYRYDNSEEVIEKMISDKTLQNLKDGVSLYTLLGLTGQKLDAANSGKIETFEIEFVKDFVGKVEVTADVQSEQSVKKTFDVNFKGLAIENLQAEKIGKGFTVTQQYGAPISEKYFDKPADLMLKLSETAMPDDATVSFDIKYEDVEGNVALYNVTDQKVSNLKTGVSLYTLVQKTVLPTLASDLSDKLEKFTIAFDGNVIGKFNVQSLVGSTEPKEVAAETGAFDIAVTEPASTAFSAQAVTNGITLTRNFTAFDDILVGMPIDVKLFVTNVSEVTDTDEVNIAVKRNAEEEKVIEVKVSDLKAGKSLYELLNLTNPTLKAEDKVASESWTIRFLEQIGGEFTVKAYQGGHEINTSNSVTMNTDIKTVYGIEGFTAVSENNQLNVTTKFREEPLSDETVKKYPVDAFLKVTSGFENEADNRKIKFTIKLGETTYPGSLTVGQLKAGVNLSDILRLTEIPTLGAHVGREDKWVISFDKSEVEPIKVDADVSLLVNGKPVSTNNVKIENAAATLSEYADLFTITANEAVNQFSTTLKLKDRSTIATPFGDLPVDARLKITADTLLSKDNYTVTISDGSAFRKETSVTKQQLNEGVKLSELLKQDPATLKTHSEQEAKWTFQVAPAEGTEVETVSAKIDLLFGNYAVKTVELKEFKIQKEVSPETDPTE